MAYYLSGFEPEDLKDFNEMESEKWVEISARINKHHKKEVKEAKKKAFFQSMRYFGIGLAVAAYITTLFLAVIGLLHVLNLI